MKRFSLAALVLVGALALGGVAAGTASAGYECFQTYVGQYKKDAPIGQQCKEYGIIVPFGYDLFEVKTGKEIEPGVLCALVEAGEPSLYKGSSCSASEEHEGESEYAKAFEQTSGSTLLVLSAEKVAELSFEGSAGSTTIETTGKKSITCAKAAATSKFSALAGKEADSESGTGSLDLSGCKKEKVACRSENHSGTKDPIETILSAVNLLTAAEETSESRLAATIVNTLPEALFVNCGGVKSEVKGSVACLVAPALEVVAAGGTVTLICKEKEGKQTTGTCKISKLTCEKLAKEPLEASLGSGFEAAGEQLEVSGSFNKMIFLDD